MPRISIGEVSLNVVDQGAGAPLLFVHGFPLDHTMWAGQIAEFSRTHRVVAPDLRGFGQSDATPGTVTMEQLADDLAKLLDALQIAEPVTFCGLSMGGYVAWQFFARHRARLAKLILCDTRAVADSPGAAKARLRSAERVEQDGPRIVADTMLGKLFSPAGGADAMGWVEETRQVILRSPRVGVAAAMRGLAQREDFSLRLGSVDVPTLVICGEEDTISPPDEMRALAAAMPHATYVEVPVAGHMAPREQVAIVNEEIRRFL